MQIFVCSINAESIVSSDESFTAIPIDDLFTKTLFISAMPRGLNDTQSAEIMKNISSAMSKEAQPHVSNVSTSEITGPSLNLSNMFQKSDDASSIGTVETSKEVTINPRGKRAINL